MDEKELRLSIQARPPEGLLNVDLAALTKVKWFAFGYNELVLSEDTRCS